jgi:hypothetical protein
VLQFWQWKISRIQTAKSKSYDVPSRIAGRADVEPAQPEHSLPSRPFDRWIVKREDVGASIIGASIISMNLYLDTFSG